MENTVKFLIENTRLRYNETVLEESDVLPARFVPRIQRMINEASGVLNKELSSSFIQEGVNLYSELAKNYVSEILHENVKARFKELQENIVNANTIGAAALGAGAMYLGKDHLPSFGSKPDSKPADVKPEVPTQDISKNIEVA
jgi:hypothetical protein